MRTISSPAWISPVPLLLPLVFLLHLCPLLAQQRSLKFNRITSEHGLADNYVLSILQDRHGFLWFGTRDGLSRFDGYTFTTYKHDVREPGSIADGSITSLYEDHEGSIWVGTHSRWLERYDRTDERFIHYRYTPAGRQHVPNGRIQGMCEDPGRNLWFAAEGAGLGISRLDRSRKQIIHFRHDSRNPRSISSDHVSHVCSDLSGTIWIATPENGLNRYDQETNSFANHSSIPAYGADSLGTITRLYPDRAGYIWVQSQERMISILDSRNHQLIPAGRLMPGIDSIRQQSISTILRDGAGNLWIGTFTGGLYRRDAVTGEQTNYRYDPSNRYSISGDQVFSLCEDRSGNIWIGTEQGVNKVSRRSSQFEHFSHDPARHTGLSGPRARGILVDSENTLWVGTGGGGLNRIAPGTREHTYYRHIPGDEGSLYQNTVNVIYQDSRGELWFGTNGGIDRIDRRSGRFTHYTHSPRDSASITGGGVWTILEDSHGNFWVGTLRGGLNLFDRERGTFRRFNYDPGDPRSLSDNSILCMHEDRAGNLWIGTDGGLNRMDRKTGTFTRFLHDETNINSLSSNRVWQILEDHQGMLWLGTSGGGLNRFDPKTGRFTHYTEKEGLAHNIVCGILESDRGELWISTNNGLSRLGRERKTFTNYTFNDGLNVSEFHFKSCCRGNDGSLLFGGVNGVIRFHPDSLSPNLRPPPLALTAFMVFDNPLKLDTAILLKRELHLDHASNFFSIEFAALDFTNPEKNRYSYMLEGFDAAWRTIQGGRPRAEYTNVPPGRYRFRVRGSNSDGIWNTEERSIDIVIEPAYWQTWWFKTSAAVTAVALAVFLLFARFRVIRKRTELERKSISFQLQALRSQMNPHFIFNALNSILHVVAVRNSEEARAYLSRFARPIRQVLEHSRHETVPLAEEIDALENYLALESLRCDGLFSYHIRVTPDIRPEEMEIPPLIIQPYAENAVKHGLSRPGVPGVLVIEFSRRGQELLCSILDNGRGRNQPKEPGNPGRPRHTSSGMSITQSRLDILNSLHGGGFRVEVTDLVAPDGCPAGTRVDVIMPVISS